MAILRIFLFLALAGSGLAHADARPLHARFAALYDAYVRAVRARDTSGYLAFFTQDFTMTTPDGKVHGYGEMKNYLAVNAKTTTAVKSYTVDIENIEPMADGTVAVIVLQKYRRTQTDPAGQPHDVVTSVVQREIWRQSAGNWKIARIQEILVGPEFVDGKFSTD